MSNLFWLTDEQMARFAPIFPRAMVASALMIDAFCAALSMAGAVAPPAGVKTPNTEGPAGLVVGNAGFCHHNAVTDCDW